MEDWPKGSSGSFQSSWLCLHQWAKPPPPPSHNRLRHGSARHCTAGRVVLFALHTNVTLALCHAMLCYAGFLSFVLLEDNRILKQDEKDHLSCLADSKPLFVVASPTSCRQGKPTVSQSRAPRPRGWPCYTAVCSCVQLSGPTGCSFSFGVVHKLRRQDEVCRLTVKEFFHQSNVNVNQGR